MQRQKSCTGAKAGAPGRRGEPAMEYVIGIDGGGTKAHLLAADRHMNAFCELMGKSTNLTSNPPQLVEENLLRLLAEFFAQTGCCPGDCRGVYLGSAGAGRASTENTLLAMLRRAGFEKNVTVGSDAAGALAGGLHSGFGLLLIAGTGSICYGRGPSGEICRAGGWGHILGDEGSGYDAACRILRAVARARDGRGSATILDEMVMEYWSLDGMDALMDCVYRSGKGKTEIAALAILLDLAYKEGDTVAAGIMEDCAQGLAELVAAAARSFQKLYGEGGAIPCACSGGMLEKSAYLRACLREILAERLPHVSLVLPEHSAAWGCASLAWASSKS